ncbi:MAG TPA: MFS transporter [Alphaproteobacteria bacterium]|jgi:MFS family permease|nr:MFS transporter [Alphaproteobacteria bacterium]
MLIRIYRENPRGWVVVTVCFFALSVVSATRSSLSVVMPSLQADLGWSRSFISSVAAWGLVTMAITAPFSGNLLDKWGPRTIFVAGLIATFLGLTATAFIQAPWQFLLTFSLLAGIGFGTVAKSMVAATVAFHFTERRGLAMGLSAAGSTAGHLALLPALAFILTTLGWRYGYVFLGLSCLVLIPFVWLLIGDAARRRRAQEPATPEGLGTRLGYLFRNPTFLLLLCSYTICGFTTAGVVETHLVAYVVTCGIPVVVGATAYGVLAAFNMGGMALAGYLTDKMNRPLLLGIVYIARGLSFILLMLLPSGDALPVFLFAMMFGLFDYASIPVTTSLVASHIGLRIMGLALGILGMFHAGGAAVGAFLGGFLYDLFQAYDWVWIGCIGLSLSAGIMAWAIRESPEAGDAVRGPAVAPAAS